MSSCSRLLIIASLVFAVLFQMNFVTADKYGSSSAANDWAAEDWARIQRTSSSSSDDAIPCYMLSCLFGSTSSSSSYSGYNSNNYGSGYGNYYGNYNNGYGNGYGSYYGNSNYRYPYYSNYYNNGYYGKK
ncbi:hypothetical protein Ddc_13349 [Ditylenchus destructor]|nr:hypothetical protein Ddc_13349 [Ditylenchus destructor]